MVFNKYWLFPDPAPRPLWLLFFYFWKAQGEDSLLLEKTRRIAWPQRSKGLNGQNVILQPQRGWNLKPSALTENLCATTSHFQQMPSHPTHVFFQNSISQQTRPQLLTTKTSNAPELTAILSFLLFLGRRPSCGWRAISPTGSVSNPLQRWLPTDYLHRFTPIFVFSLPMMSLPVLSWPPFFSF